MTTFPMNKLSELCCEILDCVNKTAPEATDVTPFKMLRTSNIRHGTIDYENVKYVSEETYMKWTRRGKLKKGDIVFTREAPLGEVGMLHEADGYFLGQRLVLFRVDETCCYNRFLLYALQFHDVKESITSSGVGATVVHMRVPECANISVPCPCLSLQKKIGDILYHYDELIENNRRQIKLLEEAAQRLYKEWFVDLRFPGHEHTPITNGIPQGWKSVRVEDVCSVLKRGITPKYDEQAEQMVINQKCIRTSIVSLDEARKHNKTYSAELDVQDGDTLICSTGTGTLGRVGCVHGEYKNTTIDSHVTLVRADKHITNKHYLYHFLKSNQSLLMQSGKGSTNQQELYKEIIGQLKLFLPERTLLHQFDALASAIHQKIASLNSSLKLLSEARDRLLPKLMSGEVEV